MDRNIPTLLLCISITTILPQGQGIRIMPPIPVPDQDPGIPYFPGNASSGSQVKLEVFLDLHCGDSAAAWGVLRQVASHYGPGRLNLVIHPMALPYHQHAFLAMQGVHYVQDAAPTRVSDYLQAVFNNMAMFSPSATRHRTQNHVVSTLADIVQRSTRVPANSFKSWIHYYYPRAVQHWKYAVRRGVAGTPWYFVNHVDLGLNPSLRMRLHDWRALLDPLVAGNRRQG